MCENVELSGLTLPKMPPLKVCFLFQTAEPHRVPGCVPAEEQIPV